MIYRQLGRTDLKVSAIGLGTMTWGKQNTEEEGHQQMDYALDQGVNFWDAAEMYPVPPSAETYGRTEEIIGSWFASRKKRDRVILATKIAGPDARLTFLRDGAKLTPSNIGKAVDDSLRRLNTDYIDLYQIHWPERPANRFGSLGFSGPIDPGQDGTALSETLDGLARCVKQGKIRHVGVSNETAWGVMRYLALAETGLGPRMVSIQNPYSLLNRSFEVNLAEIALREQCGLLAYSPLAMGVLSGKYLNGAKPQGGRLTIFPTFTRYVGPEAEAASVAYVNLAIEFGLDPAQMALAFVTQQAFVTSNLIGATTMTQLKTNIDSISITLPPELSEKIDLIHRRHTYPCP